MVVLDSVCENSAQDIRHLIRLVVEGETLSEDCAAGAMRLIMENTASPAQIAAFLTALRLKGETVTEIVSMARVMREFCHRISPRVRGVLVDTCGTGGDSVKTFNVSTISALVVAGTGVPVAKHGNRSVTSKCGSADLLEALGVNITASPETVDKCIERAGIGFMFAPVFHPAMKHVIGPRREIGIRTVFNVLGPLTNPAGAKAQVVGVYDPGLTEKLAKVLSGLGVNFGYVVHGLIGLDEISTIGPTKVSEVDDGVVRTYEVSAKDFGLKDGVLEDILGQDVSESVLVAVRILKGLEPRKEDIVLANAAAALSAAGKAKDFVEGVQIAKESLESGAAFEKLRRLIIESGGDIEKLERLEEKL